LYHGTGDLIEVVTGIPAAPIVARTIRTTVLNGPPAILAISDDGQSLAVVDGDGRSLLAMDNDFTVLPVPGAAVALAFSPGTRDIVVATGDGQIWSVKEENGQPKYYLIGSEADKTPFNAEFSGDGGHVFAAFTDGTVAVFDFTGSTPARISCGCSPLAFQRGKGNSVFFLQDSSSPLPQLVDGSAAAPRFLFIPAPVKDNLQ
jgi:hypothetical protein